MVDIPQRIQKVKLQIGEAAEKSGRKAEEIHLIAVTKTVDIERINCAVQNGITNIGENRVQEIRDKYDKITAGVSWHLIGQLQTNKVKYIIDKVDLIHSLDRISLAEELDKRGERLGRSIPVLVQVNIAKESTKAGVYEEELIAFIQEVSAFSHLSVQGLMTVAPLAVNPEDSRTYFRSMKGWFDRLKDRDIPGVEMRFLSMGMSNDFQVAIEEGANMVRVGTALFGKR